MEQVSASSRVFKCEDGERVTLTFEAHNTDMRITFRFDHEDTPQILQGDSLSFTATQDMAILRVFFHFINEAGTGGSYEVTLSGSGGGTFPDPPPVRQSGILVPIRRYAFVL